MRIAAGDVTFFLSHSFMPCIIILNESGSLPNLLYSEITQAESTSVKEEKRRGEIRREGQAHRKTDRQTARQTGRRHTDWQKQRGREHPLELPFLKRLLHFVSLCAPNLA